MFYAAAELCLRGWRTRLATKEARGARGYDLEATKGGRTILIRVSTSSGLPSFLLHQRDEYGASDDLYYVFVRLNGVGRRPDFYIVPSRVVATYIKRTHERWVNRARDPENLERRRRTELRKFPNEVGEKMPELSHIRIESFGERWDILEGGPTPTSAN